MCWEKLSAWPIICKAGRYPYAQVIFIFPPRRLAFWGLRPSLQTTGIPIIILIYIVFVSHSAHADGLMRK